MAYVRKNRVKKAKVIKPPKKMSKRNIRLMERDLTYERNIQAFLSHQNRLPAGVWLRDTNYRQNLPAGFELKCPFEKKQKDVDEAVR